MRNKLRNKKIIPYIIIVIGILGVAGLLAIDIPYIMEHYRNVEEWNSAIAQNPAYLAEINERLLEEEDRRFTNSLPRTIIYYVFMIAYTTCGCIMAIKNNRSENQSIERIRE